MRNDNRKDYNEARKGYDDREKGLPIPSGASEAYKDGWYNCHEEFACSIGNDPLRPIIVVEFIYTPDDKSNNQNK